MNLDMSIVIAIIGTLVSVIATPIVTFIAVMRFIGEQHKPAFESMAQSLEKLTANSEKLTTLVSSHEATIVQHEGRINRIERREDKS